MTYPCLFRSVIQNKSPGIKGLSSLYLVRWSLSLYFFLYLFSVEAKLSRKLLDIKGTLSPISDDTVVQKGWVHFLAECSGKQGEHALDYFYFSNVFASLILAVHFADNIEVCYWMLKITNFCHNVLAKVTFLIAATKTHLTFIGWEILGNYVNRKNSNSTIRIFKEPKM